MQNDWRQIKVTHQSQLEDPRNEKKTSWSKNPIGEKEGKSRECTQTKTEQQRQTWGRDVYRVMVVARVMGGGQGRRGRQRVCKLMIILGKHTYTHTHTLKHTQTQTHTDTHIWTHYMQKAVNLNAVEPGAVTPRKTVTTWIIDSVTQRHTPCESFQTNYRNPLSKTYYISSPI